MGNLKCITGNCISHTGQVVALRAKKLNGSDVQRVRQGLGKNPEIAADVRKVSG